MKPESSDPKLGKLEGLADLAAVITAAFASWRPPPKLTLSEWADAYFHLSAESSAQPGRWTTLPYQKGIMDAFTDPAVTFVYVMKSARIGWTKIVNALIGYSIHQDPCPMLVVQPTVDDGKGYSKEEIAPMLRDVPVLQSIIFEEAEEVGPKDSGNTILHKKFPGGVLSITGANSGAGFRRISRKRVLFDEVDGYPPSAGSDGDPIKLGTKRAEYYWDRKIGAGSTPLLAGASRIEQLFLSGDQRRYYVPCPHCGHEDYFVFRMRQVDGVTIGHYMQWDEGKPETAHFVCSMRGCVIEHKGKRDMVTRGRWFAAAPFSGTASFHIWAAYSFSPNASWATIAREFLEAVKGGAEQLKTFVNTVLGETWQEQGEAPDWERLYSRREDYPIASVPAGVKFLTCGIDVQKDRFVYEIVGWAAGRESWSIDAGVIPCDTAAPKSWLLLDELIARQYDAPSGLMRIRLTGIDSGYNSNEVYAWARRNVGRVIAVKGASGAQLALVAAPAAVDFTYGGKRYGRGCKVWRVGVDLAKSEFYGQLRLPMPLPGEAYPAGFCHFPQHGPDYFKQITAEQLVKLVKKSGHTLYEWQVKPGRENHWLDCRVYARAAANVCNLDRMRVALPPSDSRPLPLPPEVLADALQDPIHPTSGKLLEATPIVRPPPPRAAPPKPKQKSDSRFQNTWLRGRGGKPWL